MHTGGNAERNLGRDAEQETSRSRTNAGIECWVGCHQRVYTTGNYDEKTFITLLSSPSFLPQSFNDRRPPSSSSSSSSSLPPSPLNMAGSCPFACFPAPSLIPRHLPLPPLSQPALFHLRTLCNCLSKPSEWAPRMRHLQQ